MVYHDGWIRRFRMAILMLDLITGDYPRLAVLLRAGTSLGASGMLLQARSSGEVRIP